MKTSNRILFGIALVATALAGCNRQNDALPNYPPPPSPETSAGAVKPLTTPGTSVAPGEAAAPATTAPAPGSSIELRQKLEPGDSADAVAREQGNNYMSPKADGANRSNPAENPPKSK